MTSAAQRRSARATRLLVAVTCVVGAWQPCSSAQAAEPFYVGLRYEVEGSTEGCWDEAEFRRRVAQAVGYDPFRPEAAFHVDVQVGGSRALVDGRVEWNNAQGAGMGERRFVAKDGNCTKLLTEMSFAVGLQIELLRPQPGAAAGAAATAATSGAGPSASATSSAAPPATKASSTAPSQVPPSPAADDGANTEADLSRASTRTRWSIGIGPSLSWGNSPSLTGQGRLFVGVRRSVLSLELGIEGTIPVTAREPDGTAFRQFLWGGSASGCGHHGILAGCVLGKVNQLRVAGLDVDVPRSPTALVVQAGARAGATWEMSDAWSLTPHIDLLALLTPRSVALSQVDVWEMPPLAVLVGIDLGARFR